VLYYESTSTSSTSTTNTSTDTCTSTRYLHLQSDAPAQPLIIVERFAIDLELGFSAFAAVFEHVNELTNLKD
jgi:hypothetical protein